MPEFTQNNFQYGRISNRDMGRKDIGLYDKGVKDAVNVLVSKEGGVIRRPGFPVVHQFANGMRYSKLWGFRGINNRWFQVAISSDGLFLFEGSSVIYDTDGTVKTWSVPWGDDDIRNVHFLPVRQTHNRWDGNTNGVEFQTDLIITCAGYQPYEFKIRTDLTDPVSYLFERFDYLGYEVETAGSITTYDNGSTLVGIEFLTTSPFDDDAEDVGQWAVFAATNASTGIIETWEFKIDTHDAGNKRLEATYVTNRSEVLSCWGSADPDADWADNENVHFVGICFGDPSFAPTSAGILDTRLWFFSSSSHPDWVFGSRPNDPYNPENGPYNFRGDSGVATGAIKWAVIELHGEEVFWGFSTERGLIFGTAAGPYLLHNNKSPFTNSTVPQVVHMADNACHRTEPVFVGDTLVYVGQPGDVLYALKFDEPRDQYISPDFQTHSRDLISSGVRQMVYQQTPFPMIWLIMEDGTCAAHTYFPQAGILGWTRIDLEDSDEFIAIGSSRIATGEHLIHVITYSDTDSVYRLHVSGKFSNAFKSNEHSNYLDHGQHLDPADFELKQIAHTLPINAAIANDNVGNQLHSTVNLSLQVDNGFNNEAVNKYGFSYTRNEGGRLPTFGSFDADSPIPSITKIDGVQVRSKRIFYFGSVFGTSTTRRVVCDADTKNITAYMEAADSFFLFDTMVPDSSDQIQSSSASGYLNVGTLPYIEMPSLPPYLELSGTRQGSFGTGANEWVFTTVYASTDLAITTVRIRFHSIPDLADDTFLTIFSDHSGSAAADGYKIGLYNGLLGTSPQLRFIITLLSADYATDFAMSNYLDDDEFHVMQIICGTDFVTFGVDGSWATMLTPVHQPRSGTMMIGKDADHDSARVDIQEISFLETESGARCKAEDDLWTLAAAAANQFYSPICGLFPDYQKWSDKRILSAYLCTFMTDFKYIETADYKTIFPTASSVSFQTGDLTNATIDTSPTKTYARGRMLMETNASSQLLLDDGYYLWVTENTGTGGYIIQFYLDVSAVTTAASNQNWELVRMRRIDSGNPEYLKFELNYNHAGSYFQYVLTRTAAVGGDQVLTTGQIPLADIENDLFLVSFGSVGNDTRATLWVAHRNVYCKRETFDGAGADYTTWAWDTGVVDCETYLGGNSGLAGIEIYYFGQFTREINYMELQWMDEEFMNIKLIDDDTQVDADETAYTEASVAKTMKADYPTSLATLTGITVNNPVIASREILKIYHMRNLFGGAAVYSFVDGVGTATVTVDAQGILTLSDYATQAYVGVQFDSYVILLPFVGAGGRRIQVKDIILLLSNSLGVRVGDALDGDQLSWDDYIVLDSATSPQDGYYKIKFPGGHLRNGEVYIHQDQPYHMNLLEVVTNYELGEE